MRLVEEGGCLCLLGTLVSKAEQQQQQEQPLAFFFESVLFLRVRGVKFAAVPIKTIDPMLTHCNRCINMRGDKASPVFWCNKHALLSV